MRHAIRLTAAALIMTFAFVLLPYRSHAAGEWLLLARYDGMPGDTFDVRGYNFAPHEQVTVTFEGMTLQATADGGGNFVTSAYTVPFRLPGFYAVTATQGSRSAQERFHVNGYFPWGGPSTYYVLPGQPLGFYGRHYAPYEQVKLFDGAGALVATFTADGGGSIDTANTIAAIPWSWKLTTPKYTMVGQMTGASYDFEVVVGDYYANITPSSYYVPFNHPMTVDARTFAPNEPVELYLNGIKVDTRTADGGGNLLFSITSPASGMEFELKGKGQWSGAESVRHVTLAQPGWAL